MPRLKRWFPVSHDINDDGQLWELTDEFGDRALRVWLEICSILDKTENWWLCSEASCRAIFRKTRIYPKVGWKIIAFIFEKGWLKVPSKWLENRPQMAGKWLANDLSAISCCPEIVFGSPNYWKYHPNEEPLKFPDASFLPSFLPDSSLKKEKNPDPATPEPSVDLKNSEVKSEVFPLRGGGMVKQPWRIDPGVKAVADQIYQIDPKRYSRLITWITAASQHKSAAVIIATLEAFLPHAREPNLGWWAYLDKILDKTEAKANARSSEIESERFKRQDKETAAALFAGAGMGPQTR